MTYEVFLDTEDETEPPSLRTNSLASSRVIVSRPPVKTKDLPASGRFSLPLSSTDNSNCHTHSSKKGSTGMKMCMFVVDSSRLSVGRYRCSSNMSADNSSTSVACR